MHKHTANQTADGWQAWTKSFFFIRTYFSVPFTCSTFLLPTSSRLCWPCIFCQPPSSSHPLSLPSLLLSFHPLLPVSPSLSSCTRVAQLYGDSDHWGNLWEKVLWSLAQLRWERGRARRRKTLVWLCVYVKEREREEERKEESNLFGAECYSVACLSCKRAEGTSPGF